MRRWPQLVWAVVWKSTNSICEHGAGQALFVARTDAFRWRRNHNLQFSTKIVRYAPSSTVWM